MLSCFHMHACTCAYILGHTYIYTLMNTHTKMFVCMETHTYTTHTHTRHGEGRGQGFLLTTGVLFSGLHFHSFVPFVCRISWLWYHLAHLLLLLILWFWCHAQDICANANVTSHFPWTLFYLFWSIVHVLVFAPFGMFYVCYRVRVPFYPSCGFSVYPAPYWPVFPYYDSWHLNPCMCGLIFGLSFLSNWPVQLFSCVRIWFSIITIIFMT